MLLVVSALHTHTHTPLSIRLRLSVSRSLCLCLSLSMCFSLRGRGLVDRLPRLSSAALPVSVVDRGRVHTGLATAVSLCSLLLTEKKIRYFREVVGSGGVCRILLISVLFVFFFFFF